jgi:hypothetical protein
MLDEIDQAGCLQNLHQVAGRDRATTSQTGRVNDAGTRKLGCLSRNRDGQNHRPTRFQRAEDVVNAIQKGRSRNERLRELRQVVLVLVAEIRDRLQTQLDALGDCTPSNLDPRKLEHVRQHVQTHRARPWESL